MLHQSLSWLCVLLAAECGRSSPAAPEGVSGEPPLLIVIDRTKGRVTPASIGWPATESQKMWITGRDGHATVKIAEGVEQSFDFDGFSMMTANGELEAAEFWLHGMPFDDAYAHCKALAAKYDYGPIKYLDDWYQMDVPGRKSFTEGIGRKVDDCSFGLTISTTHIPKTAAVIKMGYNFGVLQRYSETCDSPKFVPQNGHREPQP